MIWAGVGADDAGGGRRGWGEACAGRGRSSSKGGGAGNRRVSRSQWVSEKVGKNGK